NQHQDRLLEGRMFFSSSKGYPIMVSSVIHYKPQEEQAKRARQKRIDERGAEAFQIPKRDWRGFSYAHLLLPSTGGVGDLTGDGGVASSGAAAAAAAAAASASVDGVSGSGGGLGSVEQIGGNASLSDKPTYRAGFLDDPALKVGRHRHMTRGDQNTGPVVSSVLLFVKPRVLKDELNARFREEHPELPPSLTLSKIRSVKRQALLGCHRAVSRSWRRRRRGRRCSGVVSSYGSGLSAAGIIFSVVVVRLYKPLTDRAPHAKPSRLPRVPPPQNMEVATVALACIYFERLCLAGLVTKPNRRLAMAACLAISYKFNE
ncbi:unnamed protein product, partial [Scytosiphon promiscuus]